MSQKNTENELNGVHIEPLKQTIEGLKANPKLGKSSFHISNKWISGGRNTTSVASFFSAGEETKHSQEFMLHHDEPAALGGDDTQANPVEHLLNALAGCITTTLVASAALQGIEVEEFESTLEGDIDLNGFFGLNPDTPKGYQAIRVGIKIKTTEEDLDKFRDMVQFSPVYSTLTNGTPIEVDIQRK